MTSKLLGLLLPVLALISAAGYVACSGLPHQTAEAAATDMGRPAAWARQIERPGLPNLHVVSRDLYRGAQPTDAGWRELEGMGVKTVLSLRAFHDDHPDPDSTLRLERISFKTWHPEDEDVVRFLRIVNDPANQPVFVHCEYGADRTGMMMAIWRVVHDGWNREEALREMREGGFEFHVWNQQLIHYVRETDLEGLARQAGLEPASKR